MKSKTDQKCRKMSLGIKILIPACALITLTVILLTLINAKVWNCQY